MLEPCYTTCIASVPVRFCWGSIAFRMHQNARIPPLHLWDSLLGWGGGPGCSPLVGPPAGPQGYEVGIHCSLGCSTLLLLLACPQLPHPLISKLLLQATGNDEHMLHLLHLYLLVPLATKAGATFKPQASAGTSCPHPDTSNFSFFLELPFPDKLKVGSPSAVQLAHAPETNTLIKEPAHNAAQLNAI